MSLGVSTVVRFDDPQEGADDFQISSSSFCLGAHSCMSRADPHPDKCTVDRLSNCTRYREIGSYKGSGKGLSFRFEFPHQPPAEHELFKQMTGDYRYELSGDVVIDVEGQNIHFRLKPITLGFFQTVVESSENEYKRGLSFAKTMFPYTSKATIFINWPDLSNKDALASSTTLLGRRVVVETETNKMMSLIPSFLQTIR